MNRRLFLQRLLAAVAVPALSSQAIAKHRGLSPLRMGVFPRRNTKITYRMFWPLAAYLSAELGIEVKLITEKNFETFWDNVRFRAYDLVHFNQYHYVVAHNKHGYNAIIMNEEQGASNLSGSIVTRNDSEIQTIEELKGKTILFGGGPRAMMSYIVPRWLMQQGGLGENDYQTRFALNPPNAIISTFNGQADAAGVGDAAMRMKVVEERIDTSKMRFLARSEPIAHLPWATSERLDPALTTHIQNALSALHTDAFGRHVLKRAELTRLLPAEDADYQQARTIIREVYGDDFGESRLS